MAATLRGIDMNLLVVLDALMSERNVTRAGERLGMTQPAVSNALKRLRALTGDRLFVRGGDGIVPTLRAVELSEPLRDALNRIELALAPTAFDPGSAELTFNLAFSDQANLIVLPPLATLLHAEAPGIELNAVAKALPTLPILLDKNQIDVAVGIFTDVPTRFRSEVLFQDRYVCLMRRDNPLAEGPLTLNRLDKAAHILLRSHPSAQALFDDVMAAHGLRRRSAVATTQTGAIGPIVRGGNMVACILAGIVEALPAEDRRGLICRTVPVPPVDIKLAWHVAGSDNVANRWLRSRIREVCQGLSFEHVGTLSGQEVGLLG